AKVATGMQAPKAILDVFTGPSGGDEFNGFRDAVPVETSSSEDSYESSDSLESGKKQNLCFQSKYITEELVKIFTEDTDSESEVFEGFTESDLDMNDKMGTMSMESDTSDDEKNDACSSESEEEASPKRRSFGLRVAFKFPSKKPVEKNDSKKREPSKSEPKEEKKSQPRRVMQRGRKLTGRKNKLKEEEEEEEEEEDNDKQKNENSEALLKRAMNIKENKEMLAKLLAELNSMPELFHMKMPNATPSKQRKTPKKVFPEARVERRLNPTRNARPPEKFALESFPASLAEELHHFRRRAVLKNRCKEEDSEGHQRKRRSSQYNVVRPVEEITEEELENVAITVKDKIYDKVMGSTCHQCRQKTIDTKTLCHNPSCGGVRGQFCGPCLRNRYGEDVRSALLDPNWICPPCRGICNCSCCRKRDGRCATGMLIHLAKFYGYNNVKEYLESLQKQLAEDD
uniref:Cell division cycle associated 7 like n=1 Tax=Latimeria chalumnae TaxID=7897 RepID=H3AIE4_LATCH